MSLDQRIDRDTVVAGYRILEPLGHGGSSVVYRAEHVQLGRPAAVKLLTPAAGGGDRQERFLRESKLAASLDHPSIVPVYDAGEEDGYLYIAMACIEGSDLRALLVQEGRLAVRRTLRILGQVASALDAAHVRGLVHRDVKPANILVGPDDRTYLSDFGVVKEVAAAGTTRTGTFIGTIEYCAPEQIEGRDVDARADVYALACVLYECLVGTPPFHRSSDIAVLNAHLHTPPPKLTKADPDAPPELEPVLAKAMSKSPLDRYATCGDLMAAARAAAAPQPQISHRRLAVSLGILAVAALLGAALALGLSSALSSKPAAAPPVTVTSAVTTPTDQRYSLDNLLIASSDARTLNTAAYVLINSGQYKRALPFARKAMRLAKKGTATLGYATFNTGYALLDLGRCAEALPYLNSSLALEPEANSVDIEPRISQATTCAQSEASGQAQSQSSAGRQGSSRGQ